MDKGLVYFWWLVLDIDYLLGSSVILGMVMFLSRDILRLEFSCEVLVVNLFGSWGYKYFNFLR